MNSNYRMLKSNNMQIKPADLAVFLISVVSGILFLLFNDVPSNRILAVLPFVYGTGYLFILTQARRMLRSKTGMIFAICEFLRMVVLVLITGFTNQYGFSAFKTDDVSLLTTSTLLIAYEYIIGSLVILIYSAKHRGENFHRSEKANLSGAEKFGLVLIILSAVALYFMFPAVSNQINFISLNAAEDRVRVTAVGANSGMDVLVTNYVHYALLCVFVILLSWMYRKYNIRGKRVYYFIALVAGLLTTAIIIGESRATIVYTAFAVLSCLALMYPKFKKQTFTWVAVGMIAVIVGMTVYRLFVVYRYDSYAAAVAAGPRVKDDYYISFFESYLLGPQSVAAGIRMSDMYPSHFTILGLLFDLFRPCMGFNLLLKNVNMETSITMFNSMLSGSASKSYGNFLQITAQGYCYFGFVLAPIFLVIFTLLAFRLEKRIAKTKSLFTYFFLSYLYIRISTTVLCGTMSGFITIASMLLWIMAFFWIIQKLFKDSAKITARRQLAE